MARWRATLLPGICSALLTRILRTSGKTGTHDFNGTSTDISWHEKALALGTMCHSWVVRYAGRNLSDGRTPDEHARGTLCKRRSGVLFVVNENRPAYAWTSDCCPAAALARRGPRGPSSIGAEAKPESIRCRSGIRCAPNHTDRYIGRKLRCPGSGKPYRQRTRRRGRCLGDGQ